MSTFGSTRPDAGSVTRAALAPDVRAAVGAPIVAQPAPVRIPEGWYDASLFDDGDLPALAATGQEITAWGNSPLSQSGGKIVHTADVANYSAGYMQIQLDQNVTEFGFVGSYPSKTGGGFSGGIAVVLPKTGWASGSLGSAGVHYVQYVNNWHISNWSGSAESPMYVPETAWSTPLALATKHVTAFRLDRDAGTLEILLPTGERRTIANALTASNTGKYVVMELYNVLQAHPSATIDAFWAESGGNIMRNVMESRTDNATIVANRLHTTGWLS